MNRERYRRPTAPLSVETTGKTVDEAINAALSRLRARRDEVDISVLQEGRGGFLGFGTREARVRVRKRGQGTAPASGDRGPRRPDGEGPHGRSRTGTRRGQEEVDRLSEELRVRRDQRRTGPPSRGREEAPERPPAGREEMRESTRGPREDRGGDRDSSRGGRGRRSSGGRRSGPRDGASSRASAEPRAPRVEAPRVHAGEQTASPAGLPDPAGLAKFTEELLAKMGFQARVEAGFADDAYEVKIEAGEDDAILIGRKGETLDAMQHVLAKMVSRGHEELLRVRVDVSEYRQRRSTELSDRALAWAQEVRDTGREVITEPLPAAERRVIHRTLSDQADVKTQALGDGLIKRVWIGPQDGNPPEDLPEMARSEEAMPQARAAAEPLPMTGEPVSLIDPWGAPPVQAGDAAPPADEWGRRPKPARGRRR